MTVEQDMMRTVLKNGTMAAELDAISDGIDRVIAERDALQDALIEAIEVIKGWHGMGMPKGTAQDIWDLYYANAPEMLRIRKALERKP